MAEPERLLDGLGVSDLEERIYRALLAGDALTADEVSQVVDTATERVGPALANLASLGLAGRSPGPPVRFVAAPPGLAVEALIRRREGEFNRARTSLAELSDAYHQGIQRTSDIFRLIEVVSDRAALRRVFLDLQQGAQREVLGFDVPPYASFSGTPNREELDALQRGVRYRIVYDPSAFDIQGMSALVQAYVDAGEEARLLANLPTKLTIVDQAVAVIPIDTGSRIIEGGVVLKDSPLLRSLRVLFEQMWAQATPFPSSTARAAPGTQQEPKTRASAGEDLDRRILALLAAGQKDGTIAMQLGLGISTVERRVGRILRDLGARSRFQGGVQAVRQGRLDAPKK